MYTYQQKLEYAKKLQKLQQLVVIKDNIHLTYKYKNQNKAIHNMHRLQDKIISNIIDEAVYGNVSPVRNIDSMISELMTTTLENERKRIHHQEDIYVNRAVELNTQKYSQILTNRVNREAVKLEQKIESELSSGIHKNLTETETIKALQEKYQDTAKARIKNIIQDSIHTNESNISWINALNEGYSYKVWMNGRSRAGVRNWHVSSFIDPVKIEDYFDIFGPRGHKQLMYPGDLYGGAENVANCRCWLRYTNRRPEILDQKQRVFNIPQTSYLNPSNNNIKTTISNTSQKVTSKIKNIGGKLTTQIKFFIKRFSKTAYNKQIKIDTDIHSNDRFSINKEKVKKQLRDKLPDDFSDKGIDYLVDIIEKRGNSDLEYGQLFGYKYGKPYSIEFGGDSNKSVRIVPKGPNKNLNLMNDDELNDYYHNIEKYTINYIEGKTHIAVQHNHTKKGLYAPSTDDFLHLIQNDYADYSICISSKEIWIIEHKGKYTLLKNRLIENKILPIENKVKSMNGLHSIDEINEWYGNQIEESINSSFDDINVYKVVL